MSVPSIVASGDYLGVSWPPGAIEGVSTAGRLAAVCGLHLALFLSGTRGCRLCLSIGWRRRNRKPKKTTLGVGFVRDCALDYLYVHPGLIGSRYASKEYDEFRVRSDRMLCPQ